jgi:hypothetical protein
LRRVFLTVRSYAAEQGAAPGRTEQLVACLDQCRVAGAGIVLQIEIEAPGGAQFGDYRTTDQA